MTQRRWVFLRGLIREQRHWEDFPARFKKAFPNDELYLIDLPGNGELNDQPSPLGVAGMVKAARIELQQQGVTGPLTLVSISLGGMVAVEWMKRYPEEIAGAVIMNSSFRNLSGFHERLNPKLYPRIVKTQLLETSAQEREFHIIDITCNLRNDKKELAQRWAGYALSRPVSKKNALRQMWAASRYKAPETLKQKSVLILSGGGDRLVDPACSKRMAEQWGVPLKVHPTAGHDLTLDAGDWVIEKISEWLNL